MKVFDFRKEAQERCRAQTCLSALARDEARVALAEAADNETALLAADRLMLAAANLPDGRMIFIDICASEGKTELSRLEIALASEHDDPALDADVAQLHLLLAPRARFKPARQAAGDFDCWTGLHPAPEILDAGADPDGKARSIWLGPCRPAVSDLSSALTLAEASKIRRLRFIVRPKRLGAPEQAAIEDIWRRTWFGPLPRVDQRAEVLAHWRATPDGARIGVEMASDAPIDDAALNALAIALFGCARSIDERRSGLVVDLRGAVFEHGPLPFAFVPTAANLRAVWRASSEDIPDHPGAVVLGRDAAGDPIRLASEDRAQHTYIVGSTGTGKSTLMRNMVREDLSKGEAVVLIDPKGELAEAAMRDALALARADAVLIDPQDEACPVRLDLFNPPGGADATEARSYVVAQLISLLMNDLYAGIPEAFGPMFEKYFRMACYLLMGARDPATRSVLRIQDVFADSDFRNRLLGESEDPGLRQFWTMAANVDNDHHSIQSMAPYITAKLSPFSDSAVMRRFFDPSTGTRLVLKELLNDGGVAIVRLPFGLLGERETALLGGMLLLQVQAAMMERMAASAGQRRPVRIYIDEFQTIANRSAAQMLAQVRGAGGSLILANQNLSQLSGGPRATDVLRSVLGNCGTMIVFRIDATDVDTLAPYLYPRIAGNALLHQATGDFVARRLVRGAPQPPQRLRGEPPP